MNYDVNLINLEVLKQNYSILVTNYEYFKNVTKGQFLNSYLNKCANPSLQVTVFNLDKIYEKIDNDYKTLISWLSDYINNLEALESNLSGNSVIINDNNIRHFVESKLRI